MNVSVSRIALIGSLRSRIVIIISLMTIAVQLAIYAIIDRSNQDFRQTHEASVSSKVVEIAPAVISAEYRQLDYELLWVENELSNLNQSDNNVASQTLALLALVDKHNSDFLIGGNRHLVLRDANGSVLYNGVAGAGEIPVLDVAPVDTVAHSGYFDQQQSYLMATSKVDVGTEQYFATVASSIDENVLPLVEKFAQVRASIVRRSGTDVAPESGNLPIPGFPEASIRSVYQGSNELSKLIGSQKSRLQMLLASSLVIVLILGIALARELTKPLQLLVEATKMIKNGDYSVKVPMMHRDEIGELAETIDLMREHVGEREDEILKLAYADSLTDLPNRVLFLSLIHISEPTRPY